jgi:hypothetical protein
MISSESHVEIPFSYEIFMVIFELISTHNIPPRIVKKNNSIELIIECYKDIKKVVFYKWKTFPNIYHPTLGANIHT